MATASTFWEDGYLVVPDFLDAGDLDFVARSIETSRRLDRMLCKDMIVPEGADEEYSPVAGELMLRHYRPKIEALIGRQLLESFAYWRIYTHGTQLLRHVDRNAVEIGATVTIRAEPERECSPLFLDDLKGEVQRIAMPPGTGVIYMGTKLPHWRDPIAAQEQWQMFLCYVLKDGDHAEEHFDGRSEGLTRDRTS